MFGFPRTSDWAPSTVLQLAQTLPRTFEKPFPRLFPHDILCIIVDWVALDSRKDLKTLATVNHQLYEITCGPIWTNVCLIVGPHQSVKANESKLQLLLERAVQQIGLKSLILRFGADLPEGNHRIHFQTQLQLLIRKASRLSSLTLNDSSKYMNLHDIVTADFAQHRFQLVQLSYNLSATPELCGFLASQPSLRRLSLYPNDLHRIPLPLEDLPPDALPNLEALLADAATLPYILKGRTVRYIAAITPNTWIHWVGRFWEPIDSAQSPPRGLTISAYSIDEIRQFLQELIIHAPTIQFLGIRIKNSSTAIWGSGLTDADLLPLRKLTSLETIRWEYNLIESRMYPPQFMQWDPRAYAGPALRCVQHELDYHSSSVKSYRKTPQEGSWERGGPGLDDWEFRPTMLLAPLRELGVSSEGLMVCCLDRMNSSSYLTALLHHRTQSASNI
ncbi:hypothetical protein DL93DRAFT_1463269 [Clavulina sp. PMI_390]|nr:hypothetical protein DL93DRAFT_1463269 [Clavulina sp. PMI_390]